ncbi:MAG: DUF3343 domain-containing protein [Clostridia bacterium]|nr:DUF3343 domain-containing protein [Clostridia bacterium]
MKHCIISMPSMTFAQKARTVLAANAIEALVSKLPHELSEKGCAWGISLACKDTEEARRILTVSDVPFKRVWHREG